MCKRNDNKKEDSNKSKRLLFWTFLYFKLLLCASFILAVENTEIHWSNASNYSLNRIFFPSDNSNHYINSLNNSFTAGGITTTYYLRSFKFFEIPNQMHKLTWNNNIMLLETSSENENQPRYQINNVKGQDSLEEKECNVCKGNGWIAVLVRCSKCEGSGIITERCKNCSGVGRIKCSSCKGNRYIYQDPGISYLCTKCRASGWILCEACKLGKIRKTCDVCRGEGKALEAIMCEHCGGDGKIVFKTGQTIKNETDSLGNQIDSEVGERFSQLKILINEGKLDKAMILLNQIKSNSPDDNRIPMFEKLILNKRQNIIKD